MGYRLSKIYTKTGDNGTSMLANGITLHKSEHIFECIGGIDELNSLIGSLITLITPTSHIKRLLTDIQHQLFEFGAELALPEHKKIMQTDIIFLEKHIDCINKTLPPLKEFILPGGSKSAAQCFYIRAYTRKVERNIALLTKGIKSDFENLLKYINRLSDLFFVLSRKLNKDENFEEIYWKNRKLKQ